MAGRPHLDQAGRGKLKGAVRTGLSRPPIAFRPAPVRPVCRRETGKAFFAFPCRVCRKPWTRGVKKAHKTRPLYHSGRVFASRRSHAFSTAPPAFFPFWGSSRRRMGLVSIFLVLARDGALRPPYPGSGEEGGGPGAPRRKAPRSGPVLLPPQAQLVQHPHQRPPARCQRILHFGRDLRIDFAPDQPVPLQLF